MGRSDARLSIDGRNPSRNDALYKSNYISNCVRARCFFFYFNGLKCHVRFPRDLVHRDAVDIMWRKMGKWGCKTNKELIDVSHAEVPSIT